jgi:uncharacterized phosphosugar-binding protein
MAQAIEKDQLIHVFGVGGHSVIGCEEFFWRAGGLACINPLFDLSLLLAGGGSKSTLLERTSGVGEKIVRAHNLKAGDVLIVTSIYGINAATIDAALEGSRRGASVIALTSTEHAERTPKDFEARHPSRKNLSEIADIVINNHVPHGDAVMQIEGVSTSMGPVSTVLVSYCIQWLVMETAAMLAKRGLRPPVWMSANVPGGDSFNNALMEKYLPRVKSL